MPKTIHFRLPGELINPFGSGHLAGAVVMLSGAIACGVRGEADDTHDYRDTTCGRCKRTKAWIAASKGEM